MGFKVKDHYFKKAKKEQFFARSIYKLEEIDKKYSVLNKGDIVLDLGYFPGSWAQYTSKVVGKSGLVVGSDIQPINEKLLKLDNIKLFEKDVFNIDGPEDLELDKAFDCVLSDMAPKTTGIKDVDQARSLDLVEKTFSLLPKVLKVGGNFVIKVFDGHDAQVYLKSQKDRFGQFKYLKPKSTRSVSKEFFVIGKDFVG